MRFSRHAVSVWSALKAQTKEAWNNTCCSSHPISGDAATENYANRLCGVISDEIVEYFSQSPSSRSSSETMADVLLLQSKIKTLNTSSTWWNHAWSDRQNHRHANLRTNQVIKHTNNVSKIYDDIANMVFDNEDTMALVLSVAYDDTIDSLFQPVRTRGDLVSFLKQCSPGRKATTKDGLFGSSVLGIYLSTRIRKGYEGQYDKAGNFERDGEGLFQRIANVDEKVRMKERIKGLQDWEPSNKPVKNDEEAVAVIHELLEEHRLPDVYDLSVGQLFLLTAERVRNFTNTRTDSKVQQKIDELARLYEEGTDVSTIPFDKWHWQEVNEIVTTMDHLIKLKASLILLKSKLMDGSAIDLFLYDPRQDKFCWHIWTMVSS